MRVRFAVLVVLSLFASNVIAEGLRGDPAAIADAKAMVEKMGGIAVWASVETVHFVHEWDFVNRPDRYIENEILDLTAPRSWVKMESEIFDYVRAYSPEYGRWSITDDEFTRESDEALADSLERAPLVFIALRGLLLVMTK